MRTRLCTVCGESYESEAETEIKLPFCSKECRWFWHMDDWEREHVAKHEEMS